VIRRRPVQKSVSVCNPLTPVIVADTRDPLLASCVLIDLTCTPTGTAPSSPSRSPGVDTLHHSDAVIGHRDYATVNESSHTRIDHHCAVACEPPVSNRTAFCA